MLYGRLVSSGMPDVVQQRKMADNEKDPADRIVNIVTCTAVWFTHVSSWWSHDHIIYSGIGHPRGTCLVIKLLLFWAVWFIHVELDGAWRVIALAFMHLRRSTRLRLSKITSSSTPCDGVFAKFRIWYGFDPQAFPIFKTESGLKQHARTHPNNQTINFGFEVEKIQ